MVYPTLLAAGGEVAHPAWRGRAVGVYRVWRALGYAVGAIAGGIVADLMGLHAVNWMAVTLSAATALVVAVRLYETHLPHPRPDQTVDTSAILPHDHTNP
ncbi:MAG: MFS transporter [Paeniglutamicibacter sp.]